ncbi:gamma-glutamyl-phosphate reductase, partial [Nocardia nova]|nr:gamma-glutamyl-phosphate reductase [Nocardia nova]
MTAGTVGEVDTVREAVHEAARRARVASRTLAQLTTAQKDAALHAAADALLAAKDAVLAANAEDIATAEAGGTAASLLDR